MLILHPFLPYFMKSSDPSLGLYEQRLLWLVRLRFLGLFSQLPLTILGRYFGYLTQGTHLVFTVVLILLLAYNAHLYRSIVVEKKKIRPLELTLQITADLWTFTFFLLLTGDSHNPFYGLFYVLAVMGGIFSSARQSIFVVSLILSIGFIQIRPVFFSYEGFGPGFSTSTLPYLVSQLFIPLLIFLMARSFGHLLEEGQKRLLSLALRSEKMDRLRALGSLSAGFSHEFASPLQNASLRMDRMLKAKSYDEEELRECKLSIQDCESILKQMNFSQLHFTEDDIEEVELTHHIEECLKDWKTTYPDFLVQFDSQKAYVRLNKLNFTQVLFNLLDNAAEASSGERKIHLQILKQDQKITLSLRDWGEGFGPDVLTRLGEPFNTSKSKGTGLGLYSAYLFMSCVGGRLDIKNLLPKGARVEMIFPEGVSK